MQLDSLAKIEEAYREALEEFDVFADAIQEGATLDDGTAIEEIKGLADQTAKIVKTIDEAQQLPSVFAALRVAMDEKRDEMGRYVITGWSSAALIRGKSCWWIQLSEDHGSHSS